MSKQPGLVGHAIWSKKTTTPADLSSPLTLKAGAAIRKSINDGLRKTLARHTRPDPDHPWRLAVDGDEVLIRVPYGWGRRLARYRPLGVIHFKGDGREGSSGYYAPAWVRDVMMRPMTAHDLRRVVRGRKLLEAAHRLGGPMAMFEAWGQEW